MVTPRRTPSSGYSIEVGCPGCGAEIALERDFRLLTCHSCGSVLRIIMPDAPPAFYVKPKRSAPEARFLLDRYCRESGRPLPGPISSLPLLYYPYWKIDAVTLKVRNTTYEVDLAEEGDPQERIEERDLRTVALTNYSTTVPAATFGDAVPVSLGMRTGVISLSPLVSSALSPDVTCISVSHPVAEATEAAVRAANAVGRFDSAGMPRNTTQLFHPRGSIIYFPYYVAESHSKAGTERYLLDGLTGRVAGHEVLQETVQATAPSEPMKFGTLGVEFHRCTNCGIDLPMGQSAVYQCANCQRVEFLEHHPKLNKQLLVAGSTDHEKSVMFPFWVIDAVAQQQRFRFAIPAFEMRNAESVYRLSSRMTTACERIQSEALYDVTPWLAPVSRNIDDALGLLEVLWYRRAAENDVLKRRGFQPCEASSISLLYVPFREDNYFFVDCILDAVTFEKAGAPVPVQ